MQPLFAIAIVALIAGLAALSLGLRRGGSPVTARRLALAGTGLIAIAALGVMAPRLLWVLAAVGGIIFALRSLGGAGNPTARSPSGRRSDVTTDWFEAWLDHDSGDMDARVRQGASAGSTLGAMTLEALLALRVELNGSEDSLRLLDAYLDRTYPQWREQDDRGNGARGTDRTAPGGAMDRRRALDILGLDEGATRQDIVDAHRRLIQRLHPDRGGSGYLAAEINQAKDFLLADSPES